VRRGMRESWAATRNLASKAAMLTRQYKCIIFKISIYQAKPAAHLS
jgi:hypothetical protein